jgi:heptaprenyl diphosphate synthase
LANVITLFTFMLYGWKTALQVSLLRVLISSLLLGTFLSPTFLLSLSGALLALLSLWCVQLPFQGQFRKYQPGAVGYAIISAVSHMSGQFLIAWYFFIPHPGLFKLLPIFMTIAVILGLLSGIITQIILDKFTTIENMNLHKDPL